MGAKVIQSPGCPVGKAGAGQALLTLRTPHGRDGLNARAGGSGAAQAVTPESPPWPPTDSQVTLGRLLTLTEHSQHAVLKATAQ